MPQALEIEKAVLGALLIDREALVIVIDILIVDHFYSNAHKIIYQAVNELYQKSEPIDLLTVTNHLHKADLIAEIGGGGYLVELTNMVASSANIEFHARIIVEKHIKRALIDVGHKLVSEGLDDGVDCFDQLDASEQALFAVTSSVSTKATTVIMDVAMDLLKDIEQANNRYLKGIGVSGVSSGLTALDKATGGWQNSDLIIIAGRPGMGKSAIVTTIAYNAAYLHNTPVAIFSLEMSKKQVTARILSLITGISTTKMRNGNIKDHEWQALGEAIEKFDKLKIYIDDTPGLGINEARAKCRRLKKNKGVQLFIFDYLQLMTGSSDKNPAFGNREQEIGKISRGLKGLAKELDTPVIALAQLSRAVETRGGAKRPQLSDLRESGTIEQDADMVSFLYRPEYYGIMEDETGTNVVGMAEFIIAKHRHGSMETVKLKFESGSTKFEDWPDEDQQYFSTQTNALVVANNASSAAPPVISATTIADMRSVDPKDIPF